MECSRSLPCPTAPLQSCGCLSSDFSQSNPIFILHDEKEPEYENCNDLKSKGIFISGKFKFENGTETICKGWGKNNKIKLILFYDCEKRRHKFNQIDIWS